MPESVLIDGTRYLPEDLIAQAATTRIGVAITTRDRRETYLATLEHWREHLPAGATLVVVDDASATPAPDATIRFETQQGIARAKNAAIAALMDAGCQHLFLADDDCYPSADGWHELYIGNPEPHLCYLFKDPDKPNKATPATLYDDGVTFALASPRGCLLYLTRAVVERVGGMRPEFGIWGHEHVEYSLRIHHAGLTTAAFQDAVGSDKFIYSMDEYAHVHRPEGFARAVPTQTRREELARNDELLEIYRGTDDYVEYRDLPNICLTTLFTRRPDPQRRRKLAADPDLVGKWRASLQGCQPVILCDELDTADPAHVRVSTTLSPYLQRWISAYQYLRDHPCANVFITDGTDVEMLHAPWSHLVPGTLVVGHEPTIVGIPWMRDNHKPYREWIEANASLQLVNAGVVGGDYQTVLAFTHDMVREIFDRGPVVVASDMAAFNYVVHTRWADRAVWGSRWVTVFKAQEQNDFSCFRHK